mmetsp:Transcript_11126/g.34547  ORF Transcript_11126/g.34547 Transcript_11126/m.34547 type:complete len:563 (-) Transcript_11126:146-1834(-)
MRFEARSRLRGDHILRAATIGHGAVADAARRRRVLLRVASGDGSVRGLFVLAAPALVLPVRAVRRTVGVVCRLAGGRARAAGLVRRAEALALELRLDLVTEGAHGKKRAHLLRHLAVLGARRARVDDLLQHEVAEAVLHQRAERFGGEDELIKDRLARHRRRRLDELLHDVRRELVAAQRDPVAGEGLLEHLARDVAREVLQHGLHDVVAVRVHGERGELRLQRLQHLGLVEVGRVLHAAHHRDAALLRRRQRDGVRRDDIDDGLQDGRAVTLEEGLQNAAGVLRRGGDGEDQLRRQEVDERRDLRLVQELDHGAHDVAALRVHDDGADVGRELLEDGLDLVRVLLAQRADEHVAPARRARGRGEAAAGLGELLVDRVGDRVVARGVAVTGRDVVGVHRGLHARRVGARVGAEEAPVGGRNARGRDRGADHRGRRLRRGRVAARIRVVTAAALLGAGHATAHSGRARAREAGVVRGGAEAGLVLVAAGGVLRGVLLLLSERRGGHRVRREVGRLLVLREATVSAIASAAVGERGGVGVEAVALLRVGGVVVRGVHGGCECGC